MRIMRTCSLMDEEPVVRCSSCLTRDSRLPMTSLRCLSSSSTKPMVAGAAVAADELRRGTDGAQGLKVPQEAHALKVWRGDFLVGTAEGDGEWRKGEEKRRRGDRRGAEREKKDRRCGGRRQWMSRG